MMFYKVLYSYNALCGMNHVDTMSLQKNSVTADNMLLLFATYHFR